MTDDPAPGAHAAPAHAAPAPAAPALVALGWDAAWAAEFAAHPYDDVEPARVAAVDRGAVDLLTADGSCRATFGGALLADLANDPMRGPCSGDWAVLRSWPDDRVTVEALLPRRTAFVRASASGESSAQVLAANVDLVLVAVSLAVEPNLGRVERMVAQAWESGAQPVVVLTKSDLVSDADLIASDVALSAPGVDVLVVSSVTGAGLDALLALARPGRTLALLGQSGVGKSTLVNALVGADVVSVAPIGARGKGRHTTVRRELLAMPGGALLLDTPGLRGIGVVDLEEGLQRAFPEIEALADQCHFGDCSHASEPGCAVLAAAETGEISPRRLESWRKLGREALWMASRSDARLRAEQRKKYIALSKSVRQSGSIRP